MSDNSDQHAPLVDEEGALKRLGHDRQLFNEFITIFLEDTPDLIEKMEQGIAQKKPTVVSGSAHSLKGLMSNFGAQACVDVAWKIETAGRAGNIDQCEAEYEDFEPLYQRLKNELQSMQ